MSTQKRGNPFLQDFFRRWVGRFVKFTRSQCDLFSTVDVCTLILFALYVVLLYVTGASFDDLFMFSSRYGHDYHVRISTAIISLAYNLDGFRSIGAVFGLPFFFFVFVHFCVALYTSHFIYDGFSHDRP